MRVRVVLFVRLGMFRGVWVFIKRNFCRYVGWVFELKFFGFGKDEVIVVVVGFFFGCFRGDVFMKIVEVLCCIEKLCVFVMF